jgi:hypothetical protein
MRLEPERKREVWAQVLKTTVTTQYASPLRSRRLEAIMLP